MSTLPVYLIFENIPLYPLIRAYPFIRHLRVVMVLYIYKDTLMYCDEGGAEFFWDAHHIRKNVRGRVPKSVFQLVVGS